MLKEALASLPVPPKMYRHFAVITVALTACIAIFADGENRDAISDEIHVQQQRTAMHQAEAQKLGPAKIGVQSAQASRGGGGFGDEGAVDVGPQGGSGEGDAIRVIDRDGSNRRVEAHEMGSYPPGMLDPSKKLMAPPVGPGRGPKKSMLPSPGQRAALERSAAARAGSPQPVI